MPLFVGEAMWERIRHMLAKEFIQVFRDPRMRLFVFLPPFVDLLVFGYAATTDVRHIRLGVYDLDRSVESRELAARFVRSGYFDLVEHVADERQARALLDRSRVQAILRVNAGFGGTLAAGRTAPVQLLLDGTDSNSAGIILSYGSRIAQQYAQEILASRLARTQGVARQPGQVELETRAWFNENLESRNFFVPGVVSLVLMITTVLLTSMAVVREKEMGTLEQVLVTPITPWEFILGKTAPFALIGLVDALLLTAAGTWWFEVPIRGSLLLLLGGAALYLMTTLAAGLLMSTICQTQQQAMMTALFFLFPAFLLSGFLFPIENMPEVIQWLTYLNPFRYFLVILRGVFLKGVGLDVLWPQYVALALLGVATLWLATRRFHKTLA